MDFRLSPEQQMLRDSARRYFSENPPSGTGPSDAWARYAEFGWLAMPVAEEHGGLGASLEDLAVLCEEFGRGRARDSLAASAILPARLLSRCAPTATVTRALSGIVDASGRLALAVYEPGLRYRLEPDCRALRQTDDRYVVSGRKIVIADGAQARALIVSARTDDVDHPFVLLLVDLTEPSSAATLRQYETIDGAKAADLELNDFSVAPENVLATGTTVLSMLEDSLDEATVCLCAEMLGCADRAIELTVEYLGVRRQFGRALAEFQALQHTVAEMAIEAGSARSQVYRALASRGASPGDCARVISGCHIKVLPAAKWIAGTAVHLHGGIGVTREYPVGHYLLRALVAERLFGDREHHLNRYLA